MSSGVELSSQDAAESGNVILQCDVCQGKQKGKISKRISKIPGLLSLSVVQCTFCDQMGHCNHVCPKRKYVIESEHVCLECTELWEGCTYAPCLSSEHCIHWCNTRMPYIKAGVVCDQCNSEWISCTFCSRKTHCWHQCTTLQLKLRRSWGLPIIQTMSIILYTFEVGSDIYLAYSYLEKDDPDYIWGSLTSTCILLAAIAMSVYSINKWRKLGCTCNNCMPMLLRFLSAILFITPLAWIAATIYWWFKLVDAKKKNNIDEATVRNFAQSYKGLHRTQLFEAFFEDAPQMVLQLYIVVLYGWDDDNNLLYQQFFSIGTSWVSVSWIMVGFYLSTHTDFYIHFCSRFTMFLWHLLTVGPRVLAMALFATIYKGYLFLFGALHTSVMFIYLECMSYEKREKTRVKDIFSDFFIALKFNFVFNPKMTFMEGKLKSTSDHYCFFYVLVFVENAVLLGLWYFNEEFKEDWYGYATAAFVVGGFLVGILFMNCFYCACHHSRQLKKQRIILPEETSL